MLAPLPNEPMAPTAFERLAEMYGNVVRCDRGGKVAFRLRDCPDVLSGLVDRYSTGQGIEAGNTSMFRQTDLAFCHDVVEATALALARSLGRVAVVAEYIFMKYSIHFHVWSAPELLELVQALRRIVQFELELFLRNGMESLIILRKPS